MVKKIFIFIALIIIFAFVFFFVWVWRKPPEKIEKVEEKLIPEGIEEKAANFDLEKIKECESMMRSENLTYILCGLDKDGKIYKKGEAVFSPGEYFVFQADLTKMEIPYEKYYACGYSNFPLYETAYPYESIQKKPGIYNPTFECSYRFIKGHYHHFVLSGFALNKKGEYLIQQIFVFDGKFSSDFDFENNLGLAKKVFELKGKIE
jgi:hypothetical protein